MVLKNESKAENGKETRKRADEMQLLMERIRQRSVASKSWDELINIAKKNMMEKRNVLDAEDRMQLQESMTLLQRTRHVANRKDLIAQLKDIATGADLKWTQTGSTVWLSADTFFVELKLADDENESTAVDAVQISHGKNTQPSTLICSLINQSKWVQLSEQLSGLFRFYPSSADSDTKLLVFNSLCCVETDLRVYSERFKANSAVDSINCTPIGVSRSRDGGRPFRLHILLNPYDLIDSKCAALLEPSIDDILEKEMGRFVELVVASGTENFLQCRSLIVDGKDWREIDASSAHIEETTNKPRPLTACMALCSVEPFLLSTAIIAEIEKATGETLQVTNRGNILQTLTATDGVVSEGLIVHLPDQSHKYLLDIAAHKNMDGGQVREIRFVHPRQAVAAIAAVRRQLMFNDIVRSCVRPVQAEQSDFSGVRFDLSFPKVGRIDCMFERPKSDGHVVIAKFYFPSSTDMSVTVEAVIGEKIEPDVGHAATNTFKKTWSVPVTMRTLLKKLGYSVESTADEGDNRGQKGIKMEADSEDNDADLYAEHDDEEPMDQCDSGDQMAQIGDQFWLSSAPSVVQLAKKVGASWLSTPYRPRAKHAPVTFQVIAIDDSTNLLDMFKEIEIVTELIPPRANQEPLKSPTPMHTPTLGHGQMPSPRLQDMLGNPSISRTQSETTMALNAFSDLEALCGDLANNDGMSVSDSMSGAGTPSSDHSRRSSLVDSMAQSPTHRAPLTPGGFGGSIFPGMPPVSSAAEFAAQQQRMMQAAMNRPSGMSNMQQPPPLSPGAASNMRQRHLSAVSSGPLCQSKSVDYDFMGQPVSTACGDPFAFQDADDASGPPKLSAPGSAGLYSQQPQPFPFPGQYPHAQSGKGARGTAVAATVKRRGRGRKAGNIGDRTLSVDAAGLPKPPRKPRVSTPGARKPRKTRGAVAVAGTLHADLQRFGSTDSLPSYGGLMSSNSYSMEKIDTPGTPFSMSDMQFPPALISQKSDPIGGLDMERQSSDDDSRSGATDSLKKNSTKSDLSSEVRRGDQQFSLLETLVSDTSDSRPESASSTSSKTQQRVKPNILSKPVGSRKGSLDVVIGKLHARSTMNDVYDDEIGSADAVDGRFDEESSRDSSVFAAEITDGESAPVTSESTELKVVIKKTLLKTPSPAQVKPQLARQKSSEVSSGEKSAKQRLQQSLKAKTDEKKPKVQKRKALDSSRDVKSSKPRLDLPAERKSSIETGIPGFSGGESIPFTLNKSLKNFKIPKVVEESRDVTKALPPQPVAERPLASPALSTPPTPTMSSAAIMLSKQPVKSILKQPSLSSAMPPPLESPASGSFRPSTTGRKPLLPSPPVVHQPIRMPPTLTPRPPSFTAPSSSGQPVGAMPVGGYGADLWGNEALDDQIIRSPDDTSIRSPDQPGFTIDESVRSPIGALNTSKDSGDRSPELKIVENE